MFRKVQTPVYTNVYSDSKGIFGVVEYNSHAELRQVMRDLDGTEFKNPFCEPTPVCPLALTSEALLCSHWTRSLVACLYRSS
jgi:hypothetical protein